MKQRFGTRIYVFQLVKTFYIFRVWNTIKRSLNNMNPRSGKILLLFIHRTDRIACHWTLVKNTNFKKFKNFKIAYIVKMRLPWPAKCRIKLSTFMLENYLYWTKMIQIWPPVCMGIKWCLESTAKTKHVCVAGLIFWHFKRQYIILIVFLHALILFKMLFSCKDKKMRRFWKCLISLLTKVSL